MPVPAHCPWHSHGIPPHLTSHCLSTPPVPAYLLRRRDPDCVPAQRGLKRLRAVAGGKERGNAAFSAGSYQDAYDHYSASLAADPSLKTPFVAQVVCNRAAAAAKLGRHEDSLADAELAIQLDSSYAKAYVRRAQVDTGGGVGGVGGVDGVAVAG